MATALILLATAILSSSTAETQAFSDPAPYCKIVGTVDRPDARYTGPKLPAWMAAKLHLTPQQADQMEWRCADGAVMVCLYGANIPCGAKADTSQDPAQPIIDFCHKNPDSAFVPMVVTGHETVVSWGCKGDTPTVTGVAPVDDQGYATTFWHPIKP